MSRGVTSNRPYLLRALYEWITDNELTPHLLVDATVVGVQVPESYIRDGRIVLNVAPAAAQTMQLGNDWVRFTARFSGVSQDVALPVGAVLAIYAKENGQGMMFTGDPEGEPPVPEGGGGATKARGRPGLRVVK
jgi:stringent starvation protein B